MSYWIDTGFYITDKAGSRLEAMVASGLWGDTNNQVLSMLLYEGIQDAISQGLIQAPLPAEFDEVEPAPEPKPDCADCGNGTKTNCEQTPDYKCVACGREVEIPF